MVLYFVVFMASTRVRNSKLYLDGWRRTRTQVAFARSLRQFDLPVHLPEKTRNTTALPPHFQQRQNTARSATITGRKASREKIQKTKTKKRLVIKSIVPTGTQQHNLRARQSRKSRPSIVAKLRKTQGGRGVKYTRRTNLRSVSAPQSCMPWKMLDKLLRAFVGKRV